MEIQYHSIVKVLNSDCQSGKLKICYNQMPETLIESRLRCRKLKPKTK